MSEMTEDGWMAKQVKESERNIELRDPYRTLRLERELDEAIAKLAKVRQYIDLSDVDREHYENLRAILEGDSK